ncbi:beta strand repeat-containing protein, partial [Amorphus sp. 3PC139-8]|uniref:beta strand repeat-containing protein n=1 Tax=Amorphus sp. 3PC139-8 TaxID=2735676 RepID=UPI00345CE93A
MIAHETALPHICGTGSNCVEARTATWRRRRSGLLAQAAVAGLVVGVASFGATGAARAASCPANPLNTTGDVLTGTCDFGSADFEIATTSDADLTISGGGSVSNADGKIATYDDLTGRVTVTGSGSTWTNTGILEVGSGDSYGIHGGDGYLTIEAGGTVVAEQVRASTSFGGDGAITVTGENSALTVNDDVYLGYFGDGTLTVENKGAVGVTKNFSIGANGSGTVTVTGDGSKLTVGGRLSINSRGEDTGVRVLSGGSLEVADASLIYGGNSGVLIASGDGTSVKFATLNVGTVAASGFATVSDGAHLEAREIILAQGSEGPSDGGTLVIGSGVDDNGLPLTAVAPGTVTGGVTFAGDKAKLVFNHTDDAYTFSSDLLDQGGDYSDSQIISYSGTTILTGDGSTFAGKTSVLDSTLQVDSTLGSATSEVYVTSSGTLSGTGTLGGDVYIMDSATLSPGASPGTLTVNGNLTLNSGSTTVFELNTPDVAGGKTNDFVSVGGDLTLGGTLEAQVGSAGYYYLFGYDGELSGAFGTLDVTGVTDAESSIDINRTGEVNLSIVGGGGQSLQFWDGTNTTPNGTVDGGTATWDADTTNWTNSDGSKNGDWAEAVGVFMGEAGTVTVDGTQNFDTLQFKTDGYLVTGGALALSPASGSAGTLNVDAGVTATIGSAIVDGSASGLLKAGSGNLTLTGANTYTGGTRIAAGKLQVAMDGALGAASGGLELAGGTLRALGTFDTARAVSLTATTGGFEVDADATLGLTGTVSGTGALMKSGAGTLVLTGTNSYTGGTQVAAGRLIGDTGSIQGDIANAGTVEFAQASDDTFAGVIGGLNGSDGQMVKSGAGALTLTGTSTLPWSVEEGGLISNTDLFFGDLNVAEEASMTFDQAFDGTYAGTISGAGDILFTGGGLVTLTGNSAGYTGSSTVTDFTLHLNGTVGGSVTLTGSGRLTGNGTVGNTTVGNGGTIAPGNSIGTITVAGNVAFGPGSTYEVETEPGGTSADLIQATGTATLTGGQVIHIGFDGAYAPESEYTILTADGGVSGTFDGVTTSLAYLDPLLGYTANSVLLYLTRNDTDFARYAETPNQRAAAYGVESLGADNAVYDAVLALDKAAAPAAFDALSGEIHASLKTGLIEDSRFVR